MLKYIARYRHQPTNLDWMQGDSNTLNRDLVYTQMVQKPPNWSLYATDLQISLLTNAIIKCNNVKVWVLLCKPF